MYMQAHEDVLDVKIISMLRLTNNVLIIGLNTQSLTFMIKVMYYRHALSNSRFTNHLKNEDNIVNVNLSKKNIVMYFQCLKKISKRMGNRTPIICTTKTYTFCFFVYSCTRHIFYTLFMSLE